MTRLTAIPIPVKYANRVVDKHHRHNDAVAGAIFAIGALAGDELQAVAIIGRPVARRLDNGYTAEVLRVCTLPYAQKGANSFLYGAAWRAWSAMGGRRMITYTLKTESGASLKGLKEMGWKRVEIKPAGGNGWHTRPREHQDVFDMDKYRWEIESGLEVPAVHPRDYTLYDDESLQAVLL